jgi:hypothetical protein
MRIREPNRCFHVRWPLAGSNREHVPQPGCERPLDDGRAIFRILPVVQMAMRINEWHWFSFAI